MNKRKLNAYLAKELKRIGKHYKREQARCAKAYPDWLDDEFNMLDSQFIWGYHSDPKVIPSFHTWNDAYIYFNRATKMYYMEVDTGFSGMKYDPDLARNELQRLSEIDEAFRNFLIEKGIPMRVNDFRLTGGALEGETLSELYIRFRIMLEGYKTYLGSIPVKSE